MVLITLTFNINASSVYEGKWYKFTDDFIRNCFSIENKSFNLIRNKIITKLNKNNLAKDIFYNIANMGFKF